MDLKLNERKTDLIFVNGACPTTSGVNDALAQELTLRLRTFRGEWFRDIQFGVPWMTRVLGKKVDKTVVDIVIQEQIRMNPKVVQITHFESDLDKQKREYSCYFRVRSVEGETDLISFNIGELNNGRID